MKRVYTNSKYTVFPGFYESVLYNSDTLYYFETDELPEGFCWEFVKGGFEKFENETCEAWVEAMKDNLFDNPIGLRIGKYTSLYSPKYYNFSTDKISFEVEVNLNELKKYCWVTCEKEFNDYLFKNWSSYDGFISFIPNNLSEYKEEYKLRNDWKKDALIDIMIEWYLLKFIDFGDVTQDVCSEDWMRIYENVTLQSEEDWSLWDFEYDDKKGYVPTHKIDAA